MLTAQEEAMVVTFRRHRWLRLHDCRYARQATIARPACSARHRWSKRPGRRLPLPDQDGAPPRKKKFKHHPIGYLPVDFAELHPEEGKC